MIKPKHLSPGDEVAIVSLSSGILGEDWAIHKLRIARERLEKDYGLRVRVMPNALRGVDYLYRHPEARAADLMEAFSRPEIRGVFSAIGGEDTIRLLPYVDLDVLKKNPKIFTGFSDTTSNHFMLYKAGLISYYGASVMTNFAEYGAINPYTAAAIRDTLFEPKPVLPIQSAPYWHDDEDERIPWCEENMHRAFPYHPEEIGYELLQGIGVREGELLGGCLDVFVELLGTSLWPARKEWEGKILFLETSEEDMNCDILCMLLRNLAAQGVLDAVEGILVGKPARRSKYEPYKEIFRKVVGLEAGRPELPILYNVNIGHANPITVLPIGVRARLDAEHKALTLLESATA
ncbi:MAG: LD-carboxypeptidase [Oscillospiraceae bacterium]|nr:LD-carboxypeptidase [Oscillospiraceae bacterium]